MRYLLLLILCVHFSCCSSGRISGRSGEALLARERALTRYGRVETEELRRYLQYLAARLAGAAGRAGVSEFEADFMILDTAQPLAYSPDAGSVLISRGLLVRLANESELAFVAAHELAHERLEHEPRLAQETDPRAKADLQRAFELAADRYAIALVAAAGYDPWAAIRALEKSLPPAAHAALNYPDARLRIAEAQAAAAALGWRPPGTVDRRDFQKLRHSLAGY